MFVSFIENLLMCRYFVSALSFRIFNSTWNLLDKCMKPGLSFKQWSRNLPKFLLLILLTLTRLFISRYIFIGILHNFIDDHLFTSTNPEIWLIDYLSFLLVFISRTSVHLIFIVTFQLVAVVAITH